MKNSKFVKHFTKIIFFTYSIITLVSCDKEGTKVIGNVGTPSFQREFNIYLDYWNETNPILRLDSVLTSNGVVINFNKEFGVKIVDNIATINIDNIRFVDGNNNYQIKNIITEEFKNGEWKEDVEFNASYFPITKLDVVLVLDASSSLGTDINKVKQYANTFVDNIFNKTKSEARIGVIDFSTKVNSLGLLSNSSSQIKSYINNIQQDQFTSLYDGMKTGFDLLAKENIAEGKVLLTFTDGEDNFSKNTNDSLLSLLNSYIDPNKVKINSFMIGLNGKGGVNKKILSNLARNGSASFPESISDLETVFKTFSNTISSVYKFSYIRSNQKILQNDKRKIRFRISTELKL